MRPAHSRNCKNTKKEHDWGGITATILLIGIIFSIIWVFIKDNNDRKNCEKFFVSYDNATTLVEVRYGNPSAFGTDIAVGFIDNNAYTQYLNGEYSESTIQIFHPYVKGNSTIINADLIINFKEYTYSSFYDEYGLDSFYLE